MRSRLENACLENACLCALLKASKLFMVGNTEAGRATRFENGLFTKINGSFLKRVSCELVGCLLREDAPIFGVSPFYGDRRRRRRL